MLPAGPVPSPDYRAGSAVAADCHLLAGLDRSRIPRRLPCAALRAITQAEFRRCTTTYTCGMGYSGSVEPAAAPSAGRAQDERINGTGASLAQQAGDDRECPAAVDVVIDQQDRPARQLGS